MRITITRAPDAAAQTRAAEVARLRAARAAAFAAEADPLFFKVARGEASQSDYDALVADIRARYPYPETPK